MLTTLELDDQLLKDAMQGSGETTEKEVVEAALKLLIQTRAQGSMRKLRGTVAWDGDLEEMRSNRFPE